MRVWDLPPAVLCRQHLLGEHRELHAIHSILRNGKKGYLRHPETLRWVGKLDALRRRHEALVLEMLRRGWQHHTSLPVVGDSTVQESYVHTIIEQQAIIKEKHCECSINKQ